MNTNHKIARSPVRRDHAESYLLTSFTELNKSGLLVVPLLLVIPIITSILALISLVLALVAWIRGYWSVAGRLFYTLVALASVIFVLFEGYWNMLGWRF